MIIAHRGLHNNMDVPENSILAYKLAVKKGYGVEFDVRVSKDNKLVIIHDGNLKRMAGTDKSVKNLTLDEMKRLHLLKTGEKIPTLNEVLKLVNGKVLLDIEIKSTRKIKLVCDLVLNGLKDYKGEILLKSFNPFIVRELKKKCDYKVGILMASLGNDNPLDAINKAIMFRFFEFDFIAVNKRALSGKYYKKYASKYPIYVWTFRGLAEAEKFVKQYPKIIPICDGLDE